MGTLYVIATPIGNMEDITYRAVRILGEADALACEDTRMTRKILDRYEIEKPRQVFAYHEHNEQQSSLGIVKLLDEDKTVALCTDSGYPGISDPGYRVINDALDAGHHVEVLPGPSAVLTALVTSGMSASSFTFKGFPPRKTGARKRFFELEKDLPHTLVLFESPFRIPQTLTDALEVLGDRRAAVCIELTKKFERISHNFLSELVEEYEGKKVKGEVTIVIAGNNQKFLK
jgi:16S rRNA (cytidine1402-2'-O)-methyltransferase